MLLTTGDSSLLCAGSNIDSSVAPGADTSLPGVGSPAPPASAGLAGGANGTSLAPQSLAQTNSTADLEGSLAWSTWPLSSTCVLLCSSGHAAVSQITLPPDAS